MITWRDIWNVLALLVCSGLMLVLWDMKRGQVPTLLGLGLLLVMVKMVRANKD